MQEGHYGAMAGDNSEKYNTVREAGTQLKSRVTSIPAALTRVDKTIQRFEPLAAELNAVIVALEGRLEPVLSSTPPGADTSDRSSRNLRDPQLVQTSPASKLAAEIEQRAASIDAYHSSIYNLMQRLQNIISRVEL